MKAAVIGANGQLGIDICKELSAQSIDVIELNHNDIEISEMDSVSSVMRTLKPDVIINTAAMHNVDKCENDPMRSFCVNGFGARNLAVISNEMDSLLIHISTDYVFDGKRNLPYTEKDIPLPLNVYGNTKLSGEHFIESIAKKFFVVRSSGLYGHYPCRAKGGLNFVELMLKLSKERPEIKVVNDEIITPTSTLELARQLVKMIKLDAYGLYHATSEGSCSWYEFAKKIFEISGVKTNLKIAEPGEFPMKVPRPKYSVLENENLKKEGLNNFKPWEAALIEYLDNR